MFLSYAVNNKADKLKAFFTDGLSWSENWYIYIIDILIVSLMLFFVSRFIRGRKAAVMITGICVLAVIHFLTEDVLPVTSMILGHMFSAGIVAIIIIFQPEIRDALEKIGTGSINSILSFGDQKKRNQQFYKTIDDVVTTTVDLANKKTGALIVIARTTNLEDVMHTGVKLNADVSSFLLRNLFFDKAPLHDGAVIIEHDKIKAAGCVLPNTKRTDLDSDLGTRHRAAIGMSEISDAIVIIVSEETGTISIAEKSNLIRNFTSDTLRKYLTEKLIKASASKSNDKT